MWLSNDEFLNDHWTIERLVGFAAGAVTILRALHSVTK